MSQQLTSAALAKAFPHLHFDEEKHRYYHPDAPKGFKSVSTWCKGYYRITDMEALAQQQADAGKWIHQADALGTWDWERHRGTMAHAALEYLGKLAIGRDSLTPEDRHLVLTQVPMTAGAVRCFLAGFDWLASLLARGYRVLAVELRVYNLALGIAGTLDLLLATPDGRALVADWKTCRRLWTRAFEDQYGLLPYLFTPFAAYEDCKLTRYALQMPAYRHLLHLAGFETHGSILVHLPPEGGPAVSYSTTGPRPNLPDFLSLVAEELDYRLAA